MATAKPTDQAPAAWLKITVANGIDGRFRAGHKFTRTPTLVNAAEFTVAQMEALRADKYLTVEDVPADTAAAGAAA